MMGSACGLKPIPEEEFQSLLLRTIIILVKHEGCEASDYPLNETQTNDTIRRDSVFIQSHDRCIPSISAGPSTAWAGEVGISATRFSGSIGAGSSITCGACQSTLIGWSLLSFWPLNPTQRQPSASSHLHRLPTADIQSSNRTSAGPMRTLIS